MAFLFQLWIESDQNRTAIKNYFLEKKELKIAQKSYPIWAYDSGQTGCVISVENISRAGIYNAAVAEEMTQLGHLFYDLLKNCPQFQYALVGVEAEEWTSWEELVQAPNDLVPGFVIHQDSYQKINCKLVLERFSTDYLWLPYEGEKWK